MISLSQLLEYLPHLNYPRTRDVPWRIEPFVYALLIIALGVLIPINCKPNRRVSQVKLTLRSARRSQRVSNRHDSISRLFCCTRTLVLPLRRKAEARKSLRPIHTRHWDVICYELRPFQLDARQDVPRKQARYFFQRLLRRRVILHLRRHILVTGGGCSEQQHHGWSPDTMQSRQIRRRNIAAARRNRYHHRWMEPQGAGECYAKHSSIPPVRPVPGFQ